MPTILLRAKAFRHACETAPILIQDDELIVGHPCGKPRAGAFSPDIAWRWVRDELDTMSTRPQDPFEISEADKKPSAKRSCRSGKAARWMKSAKPSTEKRAYGRSAARPSSATSLPPDQRRRRHLPGLDVLLFTKGMNGIKADAEAHLASLSMENRKISTASTTTKRPLKPAKG